PFGCHSLVGIELETCFLEGCGMRCLVLGVLAFLVCALGLWAQDPPKDKPPPAKAATAAEQYQALLKEFQKAEQEFGKAFRDAKTEEERQKAIREHGPNLQKFAGRFLELAQKSPKDPVAVDALIWVVANSSVDDPITGPPAQKALDLLV